MDKRFEGRRLIISACLLGLKCTYTGLPSKAWTPDFQTAIEQAIAAGIMLIPVCPEQLGGLPTPRPPAEGAASAQEILAGTGKIFTNQQTDVTAQFIRGAEETLVVARRFGARMALLKARSPSCGSGEIYSGRFDGVVIPGDGITAALLKQHGLTIMNEIQFLAKWNPQDSFEF